MQSKFRITKGMTLILSVLLSVVVNNANAGSYQIFPSLAYSNAANLNLVNKKEFILGGTEVFSRFSFNGAANGVSGSTTSRTNDFLPYGRIAMRLDPKIVVGFDVTQPLLSDIQYPLGSFIQNFATSTIIRAVNYSPKISYQATQRLALGFGLDLNTLYNGQLSFAVPTLGEMKNVGDSATIGWDAGLAYVITPITFLNLSYYSRITHNITGSSYWGAVTTRNVSARIIVPATSTVNVVQMLSPTWILSGTFRYMQWSPFKQTTLRNSAIGMVIIPANYFNSWNAQLATQFQLNEKWAGLASIMYDGNAQPTAYRGIGLPTYATWIYGVGAQYALNKQWKAKLLYGLARSNPPINATTTAGSIVGRSRVIVNAVDLNFTYDV